MFSQAKYPLVNIQKAIKHHHFIAGFLSTISMAMWKIATLNYQRVYCHIFSHLLIVQYILVIYGYPGIHHSCSLLKWLYRFIFSSTNVRYHAQNIKYHKLIRYLTWFPLNWNSQLIPQWLFIFSWISWLSIETYGDLRIPRCKKPPYINVPMQHPPFALNFFLAHIPMIFKYV